MKPLVLVVMLAISFEAWLRETNSHAAAKRGQARYDKQQYQESVDPFRRANELAPSAANAFNLGTAQIAAGTREEGSATLAAAMKEKSLRADALFNRGNSALASNAFDHAIRDYADALRVNPHHAAAKRNLEIALNRKQSAKRSSAAGDQQNQKGANQPEQQKTPSQGQQQQQAPQQGQADAEALLRSVQQQEQEELTRMRAKRDATRVGW